MEKETHLSRKQHFDRFTTLLFCFRSFRRPYRKVVIWDLALKHPVKTMKGVFKYLRYLTKIPSHPVFIARQPLNQAEFATYIAENFNAFLLGIGFCQKPLATEAHQGCPAGRFNHRCWLLEQANRTPIPLPCQACSIRILGEQALKIGLKFYIMTSGIDVANHLFLPALREGKSKKMILVLCSYSVLPIILLLFMLDIDFFLMTFKGSTCDTWEQWVAADDGDKPEQTILAETDLTALRSILEEAASITSSNRTSATHYKRMNEVYHPKIAGHYTDDP